MRGLCGWPPTLIPNELPSDPYCSYPQEPGKCDMVMCLLGTFSHMLDNESAVSAFKAVARHLRPGGLLVLELAHPGDLFDGTFIIGWVLRGVSAIDPHRLHHQPSHPPHLHPPYLLNQCRPLLGVCLNIICSHAGTGARRCGRCRLAILTRSWWNGGQSSTTLTLSHR